MTFLDKITDLGKQAAQRTGEAVESGKLTLKIKEKEKEILKIQTEIGKHVCETAQAGVEYDDAIKALISQVAAAEIEIDELTASKEGIGDDDEVKTDDENVSENVYE